MMKQIVVTSTKSKIKIGYEGENQVTKLIFPYDESWLQYGDGEFKIRILRNGDKEAYNATEIVDDRESMTLTMTVTNIELSVKGRGEMQLCYICESGCIKKSPIYEYVVSRSVDSIIAENPPSSSIIPYDIQNSLYEIHDLIGDLSKLNTNNKDNLVSAINEINQSGGGSGGGEQPSITIDSELSSISKNPVQNKVVYTSIDSINKKINGIDGEIDNISQSVDDISDNIGNIENAIDGVTDDILQLQLQKLDKSSIDEQLSDTSINPIQNKAVKSAIDSIEQSLTNSINNKADKTTATQLNDGLMSAIDKSRLDTIYSDYSSALVALGVIE